MVSDLIITFCFFLTLKCFFLVQPCKSVLKAEVALPRKSRAVNNKNTFNIGGNKNNTHIGTGASSSDSSTGVKRRLDTDSEGENDHKKHITKPEIEKTNNTSILGR